MSSKHVIRVTLLIAALVATGFIVRELNDPQRPFRTSGEYAIFEQEGKLAPPFDAKVVGEDRIFTRDDLDRPTLFVFFATFCPHCKDQMPIVGDLARRYEGTAHVFAVNGREYGNMPADEREKRIADYLAENSWADVPTLIAPAQMQSRFGLEAVPSVVLIDRDQKIHYVGLASHSTSRLESLLDEVL